MFTIIAAVVAAMIVPVLLILTLVSLIYVVDDAFSVIIAVVNVMIGNFSLMVIGAGSIVVDIIRP